MSPNDEGHGLMIFYSNKQRLIRPIFVLWFFIGVSLIHFIHYSGADALETGGTVSGKVSVFSKKILGGRQSKADMSKTVVYITGFKTKSPGTTKEIKQKEKRFVPEIVPIVAGQTIRFPNEDAIYHNVFSISPRSTFDLGQYKGATAAKTVTFNEYGVVPIYCNIHPEMIAYVVVLENDSFDITQTDGAFSIGSIPEGEVTINAWRPQAKRVGKKINIRSGQHIVVDLELIEAARIKPHDRKDGSAYPVHKADPY